MRLGHGGDDVELGTEPWRLRDKRVTCVARPSPYVSVSTPATHGSTLPALAAGG